MEFSLLVWTWMSMSLCEWGSCNRLVFFTKHFPRCWDRLQHSRDKQVRTRIELKDFSLKGYYPADKKGITSDLDANSQHGTLGWWIWLCWHTNQTSTAKQEICYNLICFFSTKSIQRGFIWPLKFVQTNVILFENTDLFVHWWHIHASLFRWRSLK